MGVRVRPHPRLSAPPAEAPTNEAAPKVRPESWTIGAYAAGPRTDESRSSTGDDQLMSTTTHPAAPATRARGREWLIPTGLIALSLVPVIAGSVRLTELSSSPEVTAANERFVADPIPVAIHIVAATVYCVLGAFQFVPSLRNRRIGWHRAAGRVLIPAGLAVALSGIWMTLFYDVPATDDGPILVGIRLVVGTVMAGGIVMAFVAVRRRDIARHRAWMIRAYALGLAAGTQAFTHLPLLLSGNQPTETDRTIAMAAGWLINVAVAEWIIRRARR